MITKEVILAHNLLQSHIGSDHNNNPLLDASLLAACNSLRPIEALLHSFLLRRGITPADNLTALIAQLPAECRTLLYIADAVAYCSQEFRPDVFARSISDPAAWVGQSGHRLMAFEAPSTVYDIAAATRAVACNEARELHNSLLSAASAASNLAILNEDLLLSHQDEHIV